MEFVNFEFQHSHEHFQKTYAPRKIIDRVSFVPVRVYAIKMVQTNNGVSMLMSNIFR